MKCLIVEDNKNNYELLQRMLEDFGYCDIAENGEEAFDIFKQAHTENEPYDVMFLDIMMPGINGDEVLRMIRSWEKNHLGEGQNVRIVMATSKTDTDTIITSYDDGCQHFLMKPYDKVEILDLMHKMGFKSQ